DRGGHGRRQLLMRLAPGTQASGSGWLGPRSAKDEPVPEGPSVRGWSSHEDHFRPSINFDVIHPVAGSYDFRHARQPGKWFHGSQSRTAAPFPCGASAAAMAASTKAGVGSASESASVAPS